MVCCAVAAAAGLRGQSGQEKPTPAGAASPIVLRSNENPYNLQPFHADFPIDLDYPTGTGREYDRSRRQAIEQVVANLQGGTSRGSWQMAMEFFWHGPEEAIEPLIEAMDRAFGNPTLGPDVVKNTVEAMGKMANERLDPALQRALEHPNEQVRQAAFGALATSGTVDTLRRMFPFFPQMNGRARAAWVHAARTRLGKDGVAMLKTLMDAPYPADVRDVVLEQALQLPVAQAAEILSGRWDHAVGEFKAVIAGVLHAAGDARGTAWLHDRLQGEDMGMLVLAIRHSCFGGLGELRDSVLRLSSHPRADVRLEVAKALRGLEGDEVDAVYELLANPDETIDIRGLALRELTRRHKPAVVTSILEELTTATGTRAKFLLNQLAASGDPRAVPLLLERFNKAPEGEGRPFLQALATMQGPEATDALLGLFLGPERLVETATSSGRRWTTLSYIPTLVLNQRGNEDRILGTYGKLPKEDWQRRAAMLSTIAGIAGDRENKAISERCLPLLRDVLFSREELPQLRVLALNLLSHRYLTIDDAMKLKNMRPEEVPQMRVLLGDFLNEYF